MDFKINVDLKLGPAGGQVLGRVMPLLSQAVQAITQQAANDWKQSVYQAKLWSVEKAAYMNSITWRMIAPLNGEITSDYRYASDIETGRPARDLKTMLNTSSKVRRTKDGRRFLVIPFRHNTPGQDAIAEAMPADIYAVAQSLDASRVIGTGERRSGEITALYPGMGMAPLGEKRQRRDPFLSKTSGGPFMVAKRNYQWGGRLSKSLLAEMGASGTQQRHMAGMVRMQTSSGAQSSSAYMTFRIMMEGSNKWIVPAKPGLHLAQKVVTRLQPIADQVLGRAMQATLDDNA